MSVRTKWESDPPRACVGSDWSRFVNGDCNNQGDAGGCDRGWQKGTCGGECRGKESKGGGWGEGGRESHVSILLPGGIR